MTEAPSRASSAWSPARMRAGLDPFSLVVISLGGWMNQRQQQVIEYLVEELLCRPREVVLLARNTDIELSLIHYGESQNVGGIPGTLIPAGKVEFI